MNPPAQAAPPGSGAPRSALLAPRPVFVLLVLAGYLGLVLAPVIRDKLGIRDRGVWFLDSYAILAANDALKQGLDPYQPNPLDIFHRPHSYSGWWFGLGAMGFTREQNFLLGGAMVLGFLAAAFAGLRPRSWAEAGYAAALLLSPPVILAVNRANNDLLIFALLGAGLWLARRGGHGGLAAFAGSVVLTTGLKFFPLVAAGALLAAPPARRGLLWSAAAGLAAALTLAGVWSSFQRAVFPEPTGTYLFGAGVIWQKTGWRGAVPAAVTLLILTGLGGWLAHRRRTTGLLEAKDDLEARLMFLAGALVLLACFVAGVSFAYRWVFSLWLVPWLWRQPGGTARTARWLLMIAAWMDGLYCLGLNVFIGPMPLEQLLRWETWWSRGTQPLVWALMALLTGWLIEAVLSLGRGLAGAQRATRSIAASQSL